MNYAYYFFRRHLNKVIIKFSSLIYNIFRKQLYFQCLVPDDILYSFRVTLVQRFQTEINQLFYMQIGLPVKRYSLKNKCHAFLFFIRQISYFRVLVAVDGVFSFFDFFPLAPWFQFESFGIELVLCAGGWFIKVDRRTDISEYLSNFDKKKKACIGKKNTFKLDSFRLEFWNWIAFVRLYTWEQTHIKYKS